MRAARLLPLFLSGYGLMIGVGTGMLLLPGMTESADLSWFTALFTATSAVCLVGLTLVDTATYFTPLGQGAILLLIQAGGWFYLFFALWLVRQLRRRFGEEVHFESVMPSDIIRRILLVSLLVEGGAFLLIFYSWGNYPFESMGQKVGMTLFHTVSAFCNAGFSILEDSLYTMPQAFVLHLAVTATFVFGGLGIDTLFDLFARSRLRQRMARPETDWRPDTKISVNTTLPLLVAGMIVIYLLERDNALIDLNFTEKLVGSLFQAATTRTAGFYSIDIQQLGNVTLLLMIGLMLIGGGAGSTAGGIKTATLYNSVAPIRGGTKRMRLARWLIGYALAVVAVGGTLLYFIESDQPGIHLLFQQVSAFSSVGLQPLLVSTLQLESQWVMLGTMLLGRVGMLGLALRLASSARII